MISTRFYFLLFLVIAHHWCALAENEEKPNFKEDNIDSFLKEVLQENIRLQQQVNYFLQRDIESDISEMKKLLETHTEEITNLRCVAPFNHKFDLPLNKP